MGTYFFTNNFCLTPHLEKKKKKKKMKMGFSIPKQATRWPKFCTKVGLIKSYHPTPTTIPWSTPFPREVDFKSRPMLKLGAPNCTKFLGDVEGTKGYNWHYSEFPWSNKKEKRFTFKLKNWNCSTQKKHQGRHIFWASPLGLDLSVGGKRIPMIHSVLELAQKNRFSKVVDGS